MLSAKNPGQRIAGAVASATAFFGLVAQGNSATAHDLNILEAQPAEMTNVAHAPKKTQQELDKEFASTIRKTCFDVEFYQRNAGFYFPQHDTQLQQGINKILRLLEAGANPNHYERYSLNAMGFPNMSAFDASILLAGLAGRPELVQAFIDRGADARLMTSNRWTPMDYAAKAFYDAQGVSRSHAVKALEVIQLLESRGARITDAASINRVYSQPPVQSYKDLATQLLGLDVLREAGLISQEEFVRAIEGDPVKREQMRSMTSLTPDYMTGTLGAKLNDYSDIIPGQPGRYAVQASATLRSLAERFAPVMGEADAGKAAATIARASGLAEDENQTLPVGTVLRIPTPGNVYLKTMIRPGLTWPQIAMELKQLNAFYKADVSEETILAELAQLNDFDPADPAVATQRLPDSKKILIPIIGSIFPNEEPLQKPATYDPSHTVDLYVMERSRSDGMEAHGRATYRMATHMSHALNPADPSIAHSWNGHLTYWPYKLDGPDTLQLLMNLPEGPLRDRFLISYSMNFVFPEDSANWFRNKRDPDNFDIESVRIYQPFLEASKPKIIMAAGNDYPKSGQYTSGVIPALSPDAVSVGAAGQFLPGEPYIIGPYSVMGADICGDLPRLGNQIENGTSFAAPMFAGHMKQFMQLYGNILTFEEILAAAMLTADTDLQDFVDKVRGEKISFSDPRQGPRDYASLERAPAPFRINGGGLPWHERCGAGRYDKKRWQAALDRMVTIKQSLSAPAEEFSRFVGIDPDHVETRTADGKTEYLYSITVPENLTLLKQVFMLPQFAGRYGDVDVIMPSGFRFRLPRSSTDAVPTSAFSYEDVKQGDTIRLVSTERLAGTAGMQLRGYKPGNTIEALRDSLIAENRLSQPAPSPAAADDGPTPGP